MTPGVRIRKQDGQTGVVPASSEGVCALIAPAEKGPSYAQLFTRPDLCSTEYGVGMMAETAAYTLDGEKPVVCVRSLTTTAGAYQNVAIERSASSASVPTANASEPLDDFSGEILIVDGGTVGVVGITYQVSVDGGKTFGAKTALGAATTIEIFDPRGTKTGAKIDFTSATLDADDSITFTTTGPRLSNSNLIDALEALRVAKVPWEEVLVVGIDADDSTVSILDLWLEALEAKGQFKFFGVNARLKGPSESEGAYRTAMQTAATSMSSIRGFVGADGGDLISVLRGIRQPRPMSIGMTRRLMAMPVSVDAARVKDGPIQGYKITDDTNNPKFHDELVFPGLDDLRLATFRSFNDRDGVFVNNPVAISPLGSDYVYVQYIRVMNKACARAFFLLEGELSEGVQTQVDPNNPDRQVILESDAAHLEELVNDDLDSTIKRPKDVSAIAFLLSRTDDLTSNGPANLTGSIELVGLKYVKTFTINARFVKVIGG